MNLLEPLSDSLRVIGYNYRDQGAKRFNPYKAVGDLEGLVRSQDGPILLGGHCTGAAMSSSVKDDVAGRVLICPYLGSELLSSLPRIIYRIGRLLPLCQFDRLIAYLGLDRFIGIRTPIPLQDVWSLRNFQPGSKDDSPYWMVASHDEILGTMYSRRNYDSVRSALKSAYPDGTDKSRLASGLTHSLNTIPGHLIPFLSSCPKRRKDRIIDSIQVYCEGRLASQASII